MEETATASRGDEEVYGELCGVVSVINLTHHRVRVPSLRWRRGGSCILKYM